MSRCTSANGPMEYVNPGDREYAEYQMKRHKYLCAKARGENVEEPEPPVERVPTTCMYCGTEFMVRPDTVRTSLKHYGGNCCKPCQIRKRGESLRGRKYCK